MDNRLKKLLAEMDVDEAIFLKSLLENLSTVSLVGASEAEVEKRLEEVMKKIEEIERRALKKLEEQRINPKCSYCGVRANEVNHMLQASTNAYICETCIEACYEQLQKLQLK